MAPPDPIEKFLETVRPFLAEWRGLDIRLMAKKHSPAAEDKVGIGWVLQLRVTPVHNEWQRELARPTPVLDGFVFLRDVLPPESLPDLVSQLREGRLEVSGQSFEIPRRDAGPPSFYAEAREGHHGEGSTAFVLTADYDRPQEYEFDSHRVSDRLKAANPPWNGLKDVMQNYIGEMHQHDSFTRTRISIVLDIGIEMMDWRIEKGKIHLVFSANDRLSRNQLSLGVIAEGVLRDSPPRRWRIDNVVQEVNPEVWEASIPLPEHVTALEVLAHYRGFRVGQTQLTAGQDPDADPRVKTLQHLAQSEDFLESLFSAAVKRQDLLEPAFCMALHCLGLQAVNVGATKWDAPDVVAHASGHWSIVAECTTATPNNGDKLAKLHRRSRDLSKTLSRPVLAVLVTTVPSDEITAADREAASKDRISLLTREGLAEVAQLVQQRPDEQAIRDFFSARVPASAVPFGRRRPEF